MGHVLPSIAAPKSSTGRSFLAEWWASFRPTRTTVLSDEDRAAIKALRNKDRVLQCGWTSRELRLYCRLYVEDHEEGLYEQSVSELP